MPIEFICLGALILLALVNIFWAGSTRTRQYGRDWNTGARDEQMPPLNPLAGRLLRAQANLFETLPLFVAALLGAAFLDRLGWKTEVGALLYVISRAIYLPLYAAGTPKVRTLVWTLATAGLLLVWWALMFG
ncbi:MAPEG family protein [Sphingomonas lutea]|uniref:MAPEG family protein n=1 Tax=Sphingomonas lutea TaxID=1045317 RepID=A0A7G9SIS6_9SPHN|nr:MAPEG family protein [Sphingomonas lutea]QNN67751.1 MAPEG family protein [Sphingomonas lutea]